MEATDQGASTFTHHPVLGEEVLFWLALQPGSQALDCTVGGAGHSVPILKAIGPTGFLWGIDRDAEALKTASQRLQEVGYPFALIHGNFGDLDMLAQQHHMTELDAVLFDLGTSSHQLTTPQRGFTFQHDAPLDMRMNQQEGIPTAADIVNGWPEEELADIIYQLGEERHSRAIARQIIQARRQKRLATTGELAGLIARVVPRTGRIHPATKTFQALRMAVNQELTAISQALPQAVRLLRQGGRLAVISFHSLEARLVKQFFQQEARDCLCPPQQPTCTCRHRKSVKIITKKALKPIHNEIKQNPRARSAQLRVLEKL